MPTFDFSQEAEQTNAKFAAEIARLTKLSADDVSSLFPSKVDKQRLVELMKIVRSSASRNKRAAQLGQNISRLGGSVVKLLDLLA